MINSEGYMLVYEPKNNRIVITLPQTMKTLTNTVSEIVDRRIDISYEEEMTILTVMKAIMEKKETEAKKTCYNCKHGAFGFDSDLGCNLWHRGKLDAKNCQFWEGAKE